MITARLARLRKRFGIAAPRVAVRTHVPWYLRWLGIVVGVALSLALAAWTYDFGRSMAGLDRDVRDHLASAQAELERSTIELQKLRGLVNATDSRIAIERAAQKDLAGQVRNLELENARLREELAIFESITSSATRTEPIAIKRLQVEPNVVPGEYRYHVLLLASTTREVPEFQGRIEFAVSAVENGRNATILIGAPGEPSADGLKLAFRNFRRLEGTFKIGPTARVDTIQARVYATGSSQVRAMQTVKPGPR